MRVVAGTWKGRHIRAPRGVVTRPTSDRVREAVFSMLVARLGADLGRGAVLDAFAGTGALGIEALSRGADSATFVERDTRALQVLEETLARLGADRCHVVRADVFRLARGGPIPGAPFSLLFADPPYRIEQAQVRALVTALGEEGSLAPGATVCYERAIAAPMEWPPGFVFVAERAYGRTMISLSAYAGGG